MWTSSLVKSNSDNIQCVPPCLSILLPTVLNGSRITLSDLDPQQVDIRVTGHFQSCFPSRRPVRRPVFPFKVGVMKDYNLKLRNLRDSGWSWERRCIKEKSKDKMYMSVGVMKDYKLKLWKLRASHIIYCERHSPELNNYLLKRYSAYGIIYESIKRERYLLKLFFMKR
jgi:hypothetical protein